MFHKSKPIFICIKIEFSLGLCSPSKTINKFYAYCHASSNMFIHALHFLLASYRKSCLKPVEQKPKYQNYAAQSHCKRFITKVIHFFIVVVVVECVKLFEKWQQSTYAHTHAFATSFSSLQTQVTPAQSISSTTKLLLMIL